MSWDSTELGSRQLAMGVPEALRARSDWVMIIAGHIKFHSPIHGIAIARCCWLFLASASFNLHHIFISCCTDGDANEIFKRCCSFAICCSVQYALAHHTMS